MREHVLTRHASWDAPKTLRSLAVPVRALFAAFIVVALVSLDLYCISQESTPMPNGTPAVHQWHTSGTPEKAAKKTIEKLNSHSARFENELRDELTLKLRGVFLSRASAYSSRAIILLAFTLKKPAKENKRRTKQETTCSVCACVCVCVCVSRIFDHLHHT